MHQNEKVITIKLVVRCDMTWVAHPLILWQLTRTSRCMRHDTTKLHVWNDSGQHHGQRETFWVQCPKLHLQLTRVKQLRGSRVWSGLMNGSGGSADVIRSFNRRHSSIHDALRGAPRWNMPRETGETREHKEMKVTRNCDVTCRKWYGSWSTDGIIVYSWCQTNSCSNYTEIRNIINEQDNKMKAQNKMNKYKWSEERNTCQM